MMSAQRWHVQEGLFITTTTFQAVEDRELQIVPHVYTKTWRTWLSNLRYAAGSVCVGLKPHDPFMTGAFARQRLVRFQAALVGSSDSSLSGEASRCSC